MTSELEDPVGLEPHDLALDALPRTPTSSGSTSYSRRRSASTESHAR